MIELLHGTGVILTTIGRKNPHDFSTFVNFSNSSSGFVPRFKTPKAQLN
jgi:hypothetical protein